VESPGIVPGIEDVDSGAAPAIVASPDVPLAREAQAVG